MVNKNKQISILGCGWLGLPLAESLIKKGFSINGSTTTLEKISILKDSEIQPFLVTLNAVEGLNDDNKINLFLENSEILIIDIPPKLRGNSSENFTAKIQNLIPFIEKSSVEKVVFISSTSVYADMPLDSARGDKSYITENTTTNPDTESGKQLLKAENLLQCNKNFKTTIIRFGGLIGENRHPIHFLAGRKNLENPQAPINLIHQTDCIGIIETIINQDFFGEIYNAVAPFHPTRKSYYLQKATELKLHLPEFDEDKPSNGKTVLSSKIEIDLNYKFQHKTL